MAAAAIQILSLDELAHLPEPAWLIDGMLEEGGLATLYGPSDSGKSFVAISMACATAGGWRWCDRPTKQGDVVYVCAEGSAGVMKRIRACCRDARGKLPDRLFVIQVPVDISKEDTVKSVNLAIKERGINPALIVIDTLARCFGEGDENSQKDMNAFVHGCDLLRQQFPGCTVLVVHHSGYDGSHARGSSALKAATDNELRLDRVGAKEGGVKNVALTTPKIKNSENDNRPLYLKLVDVDVPGSGDLPPTHSAVFKLAGGTPTREKPANENEAKVMAALASHSEGLTPKELQSEAGIKSANTLRSVRERLSEKGKVSKKGQRLFAVPVPESAVA